MELAQRLDDDDLRLQAHHARWTTANLRGRVGMMREDIERGLALYDVGRHGGHWAIYGGHDPGVCARATGAGTLWQAGFAERGAAIAADALRLADELGHPFSRCIARWFGGSYCMMVDDAAGAGRHAAEMTEIATEAKLSHSIAFGRIIGGWAIARQGELGKGCGQMETVFRHLVDSKQRGFLTFPGSFIAAAKLGMGRFEEALNLLDELQRLSLDTHQGMFIPEVHRLRAEALRRADPGSGRIEEQYRQALALSREQGAIALQLRAACGYADWLANVGRAGEGYRLVKALYEQFMEGFETPDLLAARDLLARIG